MRVSRWQAGVQAGVAGLLCALMVGQPVLAAPMAAAKRAPVGRVAMLQGQARVLHALNRFTFGPRPGDVAAVQAMGLDRWFEEQLNPQSIPDTALEERLEKFPAMQLSQEELMRRFPGPQMIRAMEQRGVGMTPPNDPMEQALYRDEREIYERQQQDQGKPEALPVAETAMRNGAAMTDAAGASMQGQDESATKAKKKGGPRVDLLGPESTNAGNLKKPGKDTAKMSADEGQAMRGMRAAGPGHKEQFYPEARVQEILALRPQARVMRVLNMQPEEMQDFRKSLSGIELAQLAEGLTAQQREVLEALQGPERMVGGEILQSRLERDIYSERQLEAVMTDFWLNHFNVYLRKNQNEPYLLPGYERDVIRAHALGKFEDLLVATAQSPAMLVYLDNWQSVGPDSQAAQRAEMVKQRMPNSPLAKNASLGLNENYGRELMELHTLGAVCAVDKDHPVSRLPKQCGTGYTQKDVTEVAKVFTGWGIDRPALGAEYAFQPQRHEPGTKRVLGRTIESNGENEGLEVLHLLATSPATAHFISYKLAVRFVSDTPPEALVQRMAKAFLASGGDIKTVLRTMYKSPEFWAAGTENAKMKTPLEFVVSAVRASGAEINNAQPLVQALDRLGMPLYGMQTPNGYSWMAEPWTGTGDLVNRMNFALALSGNRLQGVRVNWDSDAGVRTVADDGADGPEAAALIKEKALESKLLGRPASERTRATVLAQFDNPQITAEVEKAFPARVAALEQEARMVPAGAMVAQDRQAAVMAGLLLGSPEFQRR